MAYQPLEPSQGIAYAPPLYSRHSLRSSASTRTSAHQRAYSSYDELPLLDLASTTKTPLRKLDATLDESYIGTVYDNRSNFDAGSGYIQDTRLKRYGFTKSWRDWLSSARRYVKASGPARSTKLPDDTSNATTSRFPTGWRLGTWFCCSAVALCVMLEIAMLVYATKTSSNGRGSNILLEGKCEEVRELELWLLLPLNIAGTILIGTSNYVMQIVSAPERKEIDEAHAFAQPIAVAGVRFKDLAFNKTNKLRRGIWWSLGLSSLPIHFLLNAAVFSSVQASNTGVLVVSGDFDSDKTWDYCDYVSPSVTSDYVACSMYQKYKTNLTQHMSTSECLKQYSSGFQTNASSVIVVTDPRRPRWFNTPVSTKVPDLVANDLGVACRQKFRPCDNSTYSYGTNGCGYASQYPDGYEEVSDLNYNFTYDVTSTYMTITYTFLPFCQYRNILAEDGKTVIGQELNTTDRTFSNWAFNSSEELLLRDGDGLTNITSIRALFSAFSYRYWGTASVSGDYLRPQYGYLLDNRDPRFWLCTREDLQNNQQCVPSELQRKSTWSITPASMPVQECHVLPKEERCTLRYSLGILIITTCFDVVKLLAMITAVTRIAKPLTTLGDIVQSFLERPDAYTQHCRILDDDNANFWTHMVREHVRNKAFEYFKSRFGSDFLCQTVCASCHTRLSPYRIMQGKDISLLTAHRDCGIPSGSRDISVFGEQCYEWLSKGGLWWTTVSTNADRLEPTVTRRRRWFRVPSRKRWTWSSWLFLPAVALAIMYFCINFRSLLNQRLRSPWTVGFEAPDPNSLLMGGLAGTQSIYTAAILINAPQVAFSMLYFIFNATLTMMHTAHEWANFAVQRKALRVSTPRGQQRSTYWLQLPWTYSIPLVLCSGSMHWLLSRSLYIVKVDVYGYLGERESDNDYFACGYSPIPSFLLIIILALLGASVYGLAFRFLPPGMPLVRLNSLAIAAACHPDPSEKGLELQPLMWGELVEYTKDDRPHYSFSAKPVIALQETDRRPLTKTAMPLNMWPFNPAHQYI